jgi:hypothetical protein
VHDLDLLPAQELEWRSGEDGLDPPFAWLARSDCELQFEKASTLLQPRFSAEFCGGRVSFRLRCSTMNQNPFRQPLWAAGQYQLSLHRQGAGFSASYCDTSFASLTFQFPEQRRFRLLGEQLSAL